MSEGYGKQSAGFNISREQSIDLIVKTCLDNDVTDTRQIAYVLATAQHESFGFKAPDEEWGRKQALELRYSGGEQYYGRGYVHLTHWENYQKLGERIEVGRELVDRPERAAEPEIAAKVLVLGMKHGDFSPGNALGQYINKDSVDYRQARHIVNGAELTPSMHSDVPDRIADYARGWEAQVPGLVERVKREGVSLQWLEPPMCKPLDLKQGDGTADVLVAQQYLSRLGIEDDRGQTVSLDGDFGPRMTQVVRRYESSIGVKNPTGHIDDALLEKMKEATVALDPAFKLKSYTDLHGPLADGVLKPGERGEPVYEMRLQLEALGYLERAADASLKGLRTYDKDMQAAMQKFQVGENLTVLDKGEIGLDVRQALNTRAVAGHHPPTSEFFYAEKWPPHMPPYTRAEYQPQQTLDPRHVPANGHPGPSPATPTTPTPPGRQQQAPGVSGPSERLSSQPAEQAEPVAQQPRAASLADPAHPGHPEFRSTLKEVHAMESGLGVASGPHSEKVAAALAVQAAHEGVTITNVQMGSNGQVEGVQHSNAFEQSRRVSVDPGHAQTVAMADYAEQWAQARSPHLAGSRAVIERTAEQAQGIAALSQADQAMFARICQDTPAHISDDHVAHAMLGAKREGISNAEQIGRVLMAGDTLWVAGNVPGYRAATDVSQQAQSMVETVQQVHSHNQQQALAQQQEHARTQNQNSPAVV